MQVIANYEIKSSLSVFEDNKWLTIQHPSGIFRARIRNITRKDFKTPFLISLHLIFEAESLEHAREICDERLAECLNILALTTGGSFIKHRIRQIVDCTPDSKDPGIHTLFMWGDNIDHDDPQPILDGKITHSIESLLTFDIPPPITRAMRWYRLGINALSPDDQFQFFWFALELVANFKKSTEKVHDQCPKCKSALFCESCNTHPQHRPYIKQAIEALIKSVEKNCDAETIKMLGDTRNALMHGATLREIEDKLPQPHEQVVDILGKIVCNILIHQFPPEIFKNKIVVGTPSTYIHQTLSGIGHVMTVVPKDADGEFDLSFSGMKMEMIPGAPPQSALPSQIAMSPEQFERLKKLSYASEDYAEMCRRIAQRTQAHEGLVYALVVSTDIEFILESLKQKEPGEWQDLFREIIGEID